MNPKNIVFIATSLDGFIAGKNGELDWLETVPNPTENDLGYNQLIEDIDAIVMGRTTYETVRSFGNKWPYSKHVFVLSNSLSVIPKELATRVTLTSGLPTEVLDFIHKKGYKNLYIDGGRTIQSFLQNDLIDELRITTIPILLGGGFALFGSLPQYLKFSLVDSKIYLNQLVQNHFKRNR